MLDRLHKFMYKLMPDGTEKQIHPFTGTEVWIIPGRKNKPKPGKDKVKPVKITPRSPEDYCDFCEAKYFNTPPEKGRVIKVNGKYEILDRIDAENVNQAAAEFRRIPNLFEIVSYDYWYKNYEYRLGPKNREWKERYLSSETGYNHVMSVVETKLSYMGYSKKEIQNLPLDEKLYHADAFFGGCHELIVPRHHYINGDDNLLQKCSSGELTPEQHFQYFRFTIHAMEDIYESNRYVRYISVFQNWLEEAGASFDHLHTQLVALDEWGGSVDRELELARNNPNMYNEYAANFAGYKNLVLAENDYAMAFCDLGHRYPTVAVYSKSVQSGPSLHTPEELRGFANMVHAIHAAMGVGRPRNEEWYYQPRDAITPMPWHILIKWRKNIAAGFEGGTKIYVNPIRLTDLRDLIVPELFELREKGKIANIRIADECPVKPNSLKYYLKS